MLEVFSPNSVDSPEIWQNQQQGDKHQYLPGQAEYGGFYLFLLFQRY